MCFHLLLLFIHHFKYTILNGKTFFGEKCNATHEVVIIFFLLLFLFVVPNN